MDDNSRSLGRLEGEVEALQRDVTELKSDVKLLLDQIASARGGWKVLVAAASIGGSLGAGAVKLLTWATAVPIK